MRVGGIRQIVISPHLAYGKNKVAALPANAALGFEIELLNIQSPDPQPITPPANRTKTLSSFDSSLG